MKRFFLYLWQLPQNFLGLLVILATGAKRKSRAGVYCYIGNRFTQNWTGVSLGAYIIFSGHNAWSDEEVKHECGHQRQSLFLGLLYLPAIGLPSLLGNFYDRLAHCSWSRSQRKKWYYSQPWEAWADRLGGVRRWE